MNIRKTYRMQQQYYRGFSFLPLRAVKKNNYFLYKVYKQDHKLYQLFNTVLNKEVLDNHYIISIRKAIINSSVPLTQGMVSELDRARNTVSQFFRESMGDERELSYVERTIRNLHRALGNFGEIEKKLTDELTNLLSSHGFTNLYRMSSDHIDSILDVLYEVYRSIQHMIKRLSDFCTEPLLTTMDHHAAGMAKNSVHTVIGGLHRWCRVHKTIIHQLQELRAVRAAHERQEVLN